MGEFQRPTGPLPPQEAGLPPTPTPGGWGIEDPAPTGIFRVVQPPDDEGLPDLAALAQRAQATLDQSPTHDRSPGLGDIIQADSGVVAEKPSSPPTLPDLILRVPRFTPAKAVPERRPPSAGRLPRQPSGQGHAARAEERPVVRPSSYDHAPAAPVRPPGRGRTQGSDPVPTEYERATKEYVAGASTGLGRAARRLNLRTGGTPSGWTEQTNRELRRH